MEKNRNYFGIQVSCCAKGKTFFNESNYESGLFRKYFPNVPLVGFYAYGEIGHDFMPSYQDEKYTNNNQKCNNNDQRLQSLQFKSVFTLISLKP